MKIQTERTEVERSGTQESGSFRIKATAKSFEILSSALYSDKIRAIVRELSCNAYDSHVAAGCPDLPIEIKLPSVFDDTFYVKDFGLGMSHDDVMHLYTTYFESTKTNTDDFIGQLGLGSKSPFSYASTFNVESIFDGIKRIYTCYKDEDGFPAINLMHTAETTERNGITVSLSCRASDHDKFSIAARKSLMYFNPLPTFAGDQHFAPYRLMHTVSGNQWKMRDTDYYAYASGAHIVQGFVAYPVDIDQLEGAGLSSIAADVGRTDIDLFMPIGSVEVAPSREALSYDRRTIANLIAEFTRIADEIRESFQAQFDQCASAWEAATLLHKINNGSAALQKIFKRMHADSPYTWNSEPVTQAIHVPLANVDSFTIERLQLSRRKRTYKIKISNLWHPWSNESVTSDLQALTLHVEPSMILLVNDTGKRYHSPSVREYLVAREDTPLVYLIEPVQGQKINDDHVKQLIADLGIPSFVTVSSIPRKGATKYVSKRTPGVKRSKTEKLVWAGFTQREDRYSRSRTIAKFSRNTWGVQEIDICAGGVYVPIDRFAIMQIDPWFIPTNIDRVLKLGRQLGIIDDDLVVVGFNAVDRKSLGSNWKPLAQYLREQFERSPQRKRHVDAAIAHATITSVSGRLIRWIKEDVQGNKQVVSQMVDGKFKQLFGDISSTYKKIISTKASVSIDPDAINQFVSLVGNLKEVDTTTPANLIKQRVAETIDQYEMLHLIDWSERYSELPATTQEMIVNYVNLIDGSKRVDENSEQS